ncbi:MAG: MotA/TolQ/ExbB proton channel family protein [Tepidiphilus sp.]|uniref:Biopolymer transport protein ExbB/TolQ n=1 Tax=Tepidiphilus thermophilus TaxID=876478 RepID=A0A0K6IWH4_9PROT|nr:MULTISPECIES: MotA/TolQ/ExbB proton channel family protein [Tepidiphilus]MBP6999151.1 MotA/TolQ/ExbB proton channel family protein [Tepidiphilus sp.]MDK2797761.1 biopolymer transport protein ExbB [Tepidiphilus sp.]CUB07470.1 Biopolymer transport protein ExbB/TolQ [Tepidiphilus thermophilus]
MWSVIQASGWPIWPLLLASILAVAIIIERAWTLRRKRINPPGLLDSVLEELRRGASPLELAQRLEGHSPLGRVLAAGLRNYGSSREVMKEAIEDAGRVVAHELERYLTALGTIAAISPLLGLLGTIVGMIEIFASQSAAGANPQQLAHGISVALNTTGLGLIIAIPATIFWRHFRAYVDSLVIEMEQEAVRLVEVAHGERAGVGA